MNFLFGPGAPSGLASNFKFIVHFMGALRFRIEFFHNFWGAWLPRPLCFELNSLSTWDPLRFQIKLSVHLWDPPTLLGFGLCFSVILRPFSDFLRIKFSVCRRPFGGLRLYCYYSVTTLIVAATSKGYGLIMITRCSKWRKNRDSISANVSKLSPRLL